MLAAQDYGEESALIRAVGALQAAGEFRSAIIVLDLLIERLTRIGRALDENAAAWRESLVKAQAVQRTT